MTIHIINQQQALKQTKRAKSLQKPSLPRNADALKYKYKS